MSRQGYLPYGGGGNGGGPTHAAVRADFWERLEAGETLDCPTCDRVAQIRRRHLNKTMAKDLIILHRAGGCRRWVHVTKLRQMGFDGSGDISKLGKYWGLTQTKSEAKADGNPSSGFWRVTAKGIDFLKGVIRVQSPCYDFDRKPWKWADAWISIRDARGEDFDYEELMRGLP